MAVNIEERKKWNLSPGSTVKVWQRIREGEKTRLQAFEGLIIAHKHGFEPGATFTVRKVAGGTGVERIFPVFSPIIDRIEIVKKSKARRAKLYYVREKAAKQIRKKMKEIRIEKQKGPEPKEETKTEEQKQGEGENQPEVKKENAQVAELVDAQG